MWLCSWMINRLAAQALQTGLDRAGDGAAHVTEGLWWHPHLGPDIHLRLELTEHLPQILFRLSIAVRRSGIEVIDPRFHGAGHGVHTVLMGATNHQPADIAANRSLASTPEVRFALMHGTP